MLQLYLLFIILVLNGDEWSLHAPAAVPTANEAVWPPEPVNCLKCDGTLAENRFHILAKWTSPFKLAGASVQSTTGSRGVRISGSNGRNAGYTMI
jgi:hypothetical protein